MTDQACNCDWRNQICRMNTNRLENLPHLEICRQCPYKKDGHNRQYQEYEGNHLKKPTLTKELQIFSLEENQIEFGLWNAQWCNSIPTKYWEVESPI